MFWGIPAPLLVRVITCVDACCCLRWLYCNHTHVKPQNEGLNLLSDYIFLFPVKIPTENQTWKTKENTVRTNVIRSKVIGILLLNVCQQQELTEECTDLTSILAPATTSSYFSPPQQTKRFLRLWNFSPCLIIIIIIKYICVCEWLLVVLLCVLHGWSQRGAFHMTRFLFFGILYY